MRQVAVIPLLLALGISGSPSIMRPVRAQSEAFFPLEEVRPGLRGIGKTVFEGDRIEEFEVEILGILPGRPGFKQSIIIARLKGPRIERTRIFAGMSGSPVYVQGKLLGAIAYAFPFATEPIAGITPIRDMMDVLEERGAATTSRPQTVSGLSPGARLNESLFWMPLRDRLSSEGQLLPSSWGSFSALPLIPISIPLATAGISPDVLNRLMPELHRLGFIPILGISAGAVLTPLAPVTSETLIPGKSVSVQLMRGDFSLEAIGTVTYREGEKIYAFGHRLFNLGNVEMPLSEASTIAIVPNLMSPFRLSVSEKMVGTLRQDRSTGVFGVLGQAPRMIPVVIRQKKNTEGVQIYRLEMISNSVLTPLLVNLAVLNAITGSARSFGEMTVRVRGTIKVRGQEHVSLESRFSATNDAPAQAALAVALPVSYLLNSGFDVVLDAIELDIEALEERRLGTLDRVWVTRTEVRRGETIELQIYARAEDGREIVERVPVEIPPDAPLGKLLIIVGDGTAIQAYDGRLALASLDSVQNLTQLVRALNRVRKSDRLYVKLLYPSPGAVVKNEELPALPPSVLATIGSERTAGGYHPVPYATLKEIELPPTEWVITGRQQVTLTVAR